MKVGTGPTPEQSSETVKKLLKEFPGIEFINEKSATKTNLVECRIYMKNN